MTIPASRTQSGFSLIELLIAVLVLAIGLLGVAALQTNALKHNQSALQRSQATMLAYSIMDAMRANRPAAIAGQYNLARSCAPPSGGSGLIAADHRAWIAALKTNLGDFPTTCGEIACASATCTVKVYWDDSRGLGGRTEQVIEIVSRL